ncbi:MAG: ABC transporter substrate binding protein [bacterium]
MGRFSRKQIIGAVAIVMCLSIAGVWVQMRFRTPAKLYTVGLVWAPSCKGHEQLGTSVIDILSETKQFIIQSFAATNPSDLISVNAICEAALASEVDLLLSLGFNCTRSLSQISKKRKSKKPIVFIGVSELVALEIVDSLEKPGSTITGIYDAGMYSTHPIDIFLTLKPYAKSILLPYCSAPADNNEQYGKIEKQGAIESKVHVELFPIEKIEDTLPYIQNVIDQYDSLMYLEADALGPCGNGIGKLASQHNVTLFACSPDAKDTAAFTYYAEFKYIALAAYALIARILINKENPAVIPVGKLQSSRVLTINVDGCREQGMPDINVEALVTAIKGNPKLRDLEDRIIIKDKV